jgi:predicted dienelactone hydrolase
MLRILAGLMCVLSATGAVVAQTGPFTLPAPTGSHAVGTSTWSVIDSARVETFSPARFPRQVEVHAWYPAVAGKGKRAPYLRDGLLDARTLATLMRSPVDTYDALANVATHSEVDAPIVKAAERFPVLLFSHGYIGNSSAYTSLLEDLASRGYVVLSVIHPYEVTAATLGDGTVVTMLDGSGTPRQQIRDVLGEWGEEDATMASVTRATDEGERLRLLRGYLSGLKHTTAALNRWVADVRLVVESFSRATVGGAGRVREGADVERLGVFGHSMGGVTAGQFCLEDRRCRAGLNLDGIPKYGGMIDQRLDRPFLMVYSARPGRLGASDPIYRASAAPYIRVDVKDTLHLEFSDMPFWGGPLKARGAFGAMRPERAVEITRAIVAGYFDQQLSGKPSALLSGKPVFPEVTVRTLAPVPPRP